MAEQSNPNSFIYSDINIYYNIVKESHELMESLMRSARRPKPNGEPGEIITFDPERRSFKAALIVIVFSGMYLEALLHILIVKRHGIEKFKKYDQKPYKDKLELLECTDESIIKECEHYRKLRVEVVHEKACINNEKIPPIAQNEATKAFKLINSVKSYFESAREG